MTDTSVKRYRKYFSGDLTTDTLQILDEEKRTVTPAKAYLAGLIEQRVYPEHRGLLSALLEPSALQEIFADKDEYEIEYLQDQDGIHRWMRLEVELTSRGEDGSPAGYDLLLKDIDAIKKERLERERKERENEMLLNRAMDDSGLLRFTYYVTEGYAIASQGIEDLHGSPRRLENMPQSFGDVFVRPDYRAIHNEMYERCFQGINHASCELVDTQGHWTRVTLEIIEKDENGKPTMVLGLVENTDELHSVRTEASLMAEVCAFAVENHYEEANLIDIPSNTVRSLMQGTRGVDMGFHHECEENYDGGIDHLMKRHAADEEDRELLDTLHLKKLVAILEEKGRHSIRCRLRCSDGTLTWKLVECIFFKTDRSKIIMLTTDVQEEEDIKEQLRISAEEAQEANHAKSAFLANMSHEIRTPMNAIVGISEILLGKQLPEDVLMDINTIQNSGSSLLGIINDILDFSKIETGKFEINEVEYMLPSVLMDISNVISVRLSGRPVFFMMDIDPQLPNHYVGDDIRVKQILLNLIGNSAKFTREGFIELSARGHFLDEVHYELVFEVRDSGIGIKKEDFGKLFRTFSQVDTRRNRAITGSGLGLSISKNLALMMGGDLTVESTYGKGSIFTVRIVQEVRHYEKIGEVHNKNVRILICEQNETIIHSLKRSLDKLGLHYEICREPDKIRDYAGMTHVMIRRKAFGNVKEKLEFMFRQRNIYLILDNDEHAEGHYMKYKQLQLPLICMQLINALNGEEIVTSIKKKTFDRSQIVPLTFARILIVDDNTTNLQVAQGLMAPYKMKIDVATSGFKAIELVKAIHYDAIFMDHMMPEMDGIETTQYIRSMNGEYFRNVPIIALTANAMSEAKAMFLESGMDDFVAKPIEMTELHRVLKKFVQSKAPEGYLKEISEQQQKHAGSVKKTGFLPGLDTPAAPEVSGVMSAGVMSADIEAGGMLTQLLVQNNALLSQNMLLLKGLLGQEITMPEQHPVSEAEYEQPEEDDLQEQPEMEELHDHIPGVDMQSSLDNYGGSVSIYHNILKTYYYDIRERAPKLDVLFESCDIENFTISVHAIKSASRGAGANELGELAYELESAGKAGDWESIRQNYPVFRKELELMVENTGKYVNRYLVEEKPQTDEVETAFDPGLTEQIKQACADMDYLRAEELLHELDQKRYQPELEDLLRELLQLCTGFDYDRLDEKVQSL